MKKIRKNWRSFDRNTLLERILAQWWHPVASIESLDIRHRAKRAVSYRRTATAIEMASKVGAFFVVVVFIETMAAAGEKQSEYSPYDRVRWLLVKP
jgi:hypothetical protein